MKNAGGGQNKLMGAGPHFDLLVTGAGRDEG